MFMDMINGEDVLPVIPNGTYGTGSNPVSEVIDTQLYEGGVLFVADAGAISEDQAFTIQCSNTLASTNPGSQAALHLPVTPGTDDNILWTATNPGTAGNHLKIAYAGGGAEAVELSAAISVNTATPAITTITFTLAGTTAEPTSTANDIIAMVYTTPALLALVTPTLATVTGNGGINDGTGVLAVTAATALAGGGDASGVLANAYTLLNSDYPQVILPGASTAAEQGTPGSSLTLTLPTTAANALTKLCQYHGIYRYIQLVSTAASSAAYRVFAIGGGKRGYGNLTGIAQ